MVIDEFWKRLAEFGVEVPPDVRRRIGIELNQERIFIRPQAANRKTAVLAHGTGVPATFIARKEGLSVRQVRRIRKLFNG